MESPPPRVGGRARGLKRLALRLGGPKLLGLLLSAKHRFSASPLERRVQSIETQLRRRAEQELRSAVSAPPRSWPRDVPVHHCSSVNNPAAVAWCGSLSPDLTLVYGTSILRKAILEIPRLGTLNAHSSMLPHYRGVFSEFWQVLHGRLDTAGVTIHFVNQGVDRGDIVSQHPTDATPGIDPFRLRVRNVATTVREYPAAASRVLSGRASPSRQIELDLPDYRSRDLTLEKRAELLRRFGFEL